MELAAIVAAMIAGAFVKGVTGMGLPPIAIPVMAPIVGVEHAVVVMALPTVVTNTWQAWTNRRSWRDTRHLPALLATGTAGGIAGAWLLTALNEQVLAVTVAVLVLAYVVLQVLRPQARLPEQVGRYGSAPVGLVAGALQGATGLSGSVFATWLHALQLTRSAFVLSIALLFQVSALAQMAGLVAFERYTSRRVSDSLLACVLVMLVLPIGSRWADKLPRRRFDQMVLAVLVLSAVALVVDAFSA